MTKEEAIKILKAIRVYECYPKSASEETKEAIDMAIEALSATQTDLINRGRADAIEAIQNAYCKPCKERGDDHNEVRCRVCEYDNAIIQIDALPSTDAVSREEYEDIIKDYRKQYENMNNEIADLEAKLSADAVQGEWVCKEREYNDCDGYYAYYWYECSVCGARPPKDTWKNEWHSNFCPSCGAKMSNK